MSFQSSVNQAIGTVGAVAGVKRVIEGQQKGNELAQETNDKQAEANAIAKANLQVKALEAEKEEKNAQDALLKNNSAIYDREVQQKGYKKAIEDPDKALDARYNAAKEEWDKASKDYEMRTSEYELYHTQKSKPSNKRLTKATIAMDEANDEIAARANLKFDLEIAQKKREALSLELNQLGGKK